MHIHDIFQAHPTTFSFEFFPPKTDRASDELFENIAQLQALQPSFVSVTYGAGGSTRERTHDLIVRIQRETELTAVSHLTCVCHSREELAAILDRYAESGIENILALGGDPPKNLAGYDRARDAFQYAEQLVRFIRARTQVPDSRGFGIGVAGFPEGHPGTPNRLKELDYLKRKVDAGADYICTQLFFSNADFYDFRERCELAGIRVPIIAGIMPITSQGEPGPDGRAGARGPDSRPGSCGRSTVATTRRPSPRSASTGPPSNAATCWTTRSGASTSTRSTARTRPGRSTRTSASRTRMPSRNDRRPEPTGEDGPLRARLERSRPKPCGSASTRSASPRPSRLPAIPTSCDGSRPAMRPAWITSIATRRSGRTPTGCSTGCVRS